MCRTSNPLVYRTAAVALAVLLAGCESHGPSIGATGSESATNSTSADNSGKRERTVSLSGSAKVSIPAFAVIAEGLQSEYKADIDPSGLMLVSALTDTGDGDVCRGFEAEPSYQQAAKKLQADPTDAGALSTMHHVYRVPVLWVLKAAAGWEISAMDRSEKGKQLANRYIAALMQSTIYANDLFNKLAEAVGQQGLSDPIAARAAVWRAYSALPWEDLSAACHRAFKTADHSGGRTVGNGNFWFTAAGLGAFEFDAGGVKWKRWGMTWFGEGHISGISRVLELASASTLTQTLSAATGTQTKTDAATGASAETKAGK